MHDRGDDNPVKALIIMFQRVSFGSCSQYLFIPIFLCTDSRPGGMTGHMFRPSYGAVAHGATLLRALGLCVKSVILQAQQVCVYARQKARGALRMCGACMHA